MYILVTAIQFKHGGICKYTFTHKQYTKQHNETEYNTYIRIKMHIHTIRGDRGSTVVKVLCYKSEGRWFDPSLCQWIFH